MLYLFYGELPKRCFAYDFWLIFWSRLVKGLIRWCIALFGSGTIIGEHVISWGISCARLMMALKYLNATCWMHTKTCLFVLNVLTLGAYRRFISNLSARNNMSFADFCRFMLNWSWQKHTLGLDSLHCCLYWFFASPKCTILSVLQNLFFFCLH